MSFDFITISSNPSFLCIRMYYSIADSFREMGEDCETVVAFGKARVHVLR